MYHYIPGSKTINGTVLVGSRLANIFLGLNRTSGESWSCIRFRDIYLVKIRHLLEYQYWESVCYLLLGH